jgi:hypothetical protein
MIQRNVILLISLAFISVEGCQKEEAPAPIAESTPQPTATPEITPNPARGAIQAAIQWYPDLVKKDSTFNLMFLDLYQDRKKTNPASLATPDWPLTLAKEVADKLGIKPLTMPVVATVQPMPSATPSDNWNNPLDEGAHDKDTNAMHGQTLHYPNW